jgi:expansin (peptidoglycan-binding protein)
VVLALAGAGCGGGGSGTDAGTAPGTDTGTPGTDAGSTPGTDAGSTPMGDAGPVGSLGPSHDGTYNLGPVDWAETAWHNACSPYPASIQMLEGNLLAGVSNAVGTGNYCDACIELTTAMGRRVVARVVTYGDTVGPGDVDLSQEAYDMLSPGDATRAMQWHLVTCPTTAPLYVQFQTGANEWWTSFWIRNPRVAIDHVEVTSTNHATAVSLMAGSDGTFTDGGGFGAGAFTLRVVGVDGSHFEQTFPGFMPGDNVAASGNL